MRLNKTLILFFLLINIVCDTFAPKSIRDEGQTSGSKDEENYNEEFKRNLQLCEMEILTAFKHEYGFDNFCEGLLNISANEDNFYGRQSHTSAAHSYYHDLLDTLPKLNLPSLISPQIFCRSLYSDNAQKCIRLIQDAGCHADADGIACIRHLYFHWKLRDINTTTQPIHGTSDLSDETLMEVFFKGYENPSDFEDEVLLQEYYEKHGHPRMSDEDIMNNYQIHLAETEVPYDFETFRNVMLEVDRENNREYYLHQARLEKYGIPTVSYNDLCREHLRRDFLKHSTYQKITQTFC